VNQRLAERPFRYTVCPRCGTYSLADPPNDLSPYYPATYYEDIDESLESFDAALAHGQLELLLPFVSEGRVIDVGPATGAFLRQAQRHGFALAAVERDPRCCEILRALGVDVVETTDPAGGLRQLAPADAITMFHVIEHVADPMRLIDVAAEHLRPGGALIVATPNPRSLSFRICGRWWMGVDAPRHLHLLPFDVIRRRAESHGLRLAALTTVDPVGRHCDFHSWTPWADHVTSRLGSRGGQIAGYHLRNAVQYLARPVEGRGLRGSTFTAVFISERRSRC
jgi:2-polyprenyl-3-methyl-5-hydroxy-6-metoxy-1,4-benzoquinol methylase